MHRVKLYPSLISGDLLNLEHQITMLEPYCDGFHIDVMDFNFVPNLTWGPAFINAIARATKLPLMLHCMVTNPLQLLSMITIKELSYASIHIETIKNFNEVKKVVHEKKLKLSIAIKPKTPLSSLFEFLPYIDHVLLMSVEPGFSGQHFMPLAADRLCELNTYRTKHTLTFEIGMDGGITTENIVPLIDQGANDFGIAHAIFGQKNPVAALKQLRSITQNII